MMHSHRSADLPRVRVARSAWRRCLVELDRAAPDEAVMVPLVALRPRDPDRNPCTSIGLGGLAEVVVPVILTVPQRLQRASAVRVAVLPSTNGLLNPRIEALVRSHPRLRTAAYLHSHPFARQRTWPSQGPWADYDGHMLPLLRHNRGSGLETSFSFIACRGRAGWMLQCFALADDQSIVDLGFATVVSDEDPRVAQALLPGLQAVPRARCLLRRLRRGLRRQGIASHLDELFDGWSRLRIEAGARIFVGLLPDLFFERPAQWFVVCGSQVEPVEAPSMAEPDAFGSWLRTGGGTGTGTGTSRACGQTSREATTLDSRRTA